MEQADKFTEIFAELKALLQTFESELDCKQDVPGSYYLDTRYMMKNKKPLFFGAARTGKNYVSYHLMPVYVMPQLLETVSPELLQRMQGKSCFNFTYVDPVLFDELSALTAAGLESYKAAGYV